MKFTFFFENKFCDMKESSETKYYCVRRKFFKIFLHSPKKKNKEYLKRKKKVVEKN